MIVVVAVIGNGVVEHGTVVTIVLPFTTVVEVVIDCAGAGATSALFEPWAADWAGADAAPALLLEP